MNQDTSYPFFIFSNNSAYWKSWIFWVVIISIVIIIIIWLFWGGQEQQFVGYQPLATNFNCPHLVDKNTTTRLGTNHDFNQRLSSNKIASHSDKISAENLSRRLNMITGQRPATPIINQKIPLVQNNNLIGLNHLALVGSTPLLYSPRSQNYDQSAGISSSYYSPKISSNQAIPIYLSSPSKLSSNQVPSYRDLNIGTFAERKTKAESKGESVCRQFLEKYYSQLFPRIRPDFLKNPLTDRNLELDGYNSKLNIAFEYNGYQHYHYPNRFHSSEDEFYQQMKRDKFKIEICNWAGIYLIIIPYTVPYEHIPQFIYQRLPHRVHLLSQKL